MAPSSISMPVVCHAQITFSPLHSASLFLRTVVVTVWGHRMIQDNQSFHLKILRLVTSFFIAFLQYKATYSQISEIWMWMSLRNHYSPTTKILSVAHQKQQYLFPRGCNDLDPSRDIWNPAEAVNSVAFSVL